MTFLITNVGHMTFKKLLIAGSAEHLVEVDGVRRALRAGVGAVALKSANGSDAARDQLSTVSNHAD
jgi:dihydroorotate dehydrogenase (NAD+) catalytic subunit